MNLRRYLSDLIFCAGIKNGELPAPKFTCVWHTLLSGFPAGHSAEGKEAIDLTDSVYQYRDTVVF